MGRCPHGNALAHRTSRCRRKWARRLCRTGSSAPALRGIFRSNLLDVRQVAGDCHCDVTAARKTVPKSGCLQELARIEDYEYLMCRYKVNIADAVTSRCSQRDELVECGGLQLGEQGRL